MNDNDCKHENMNKLVHAVLQVPAAMRAITKRNLRKKDVTIEAADWSNARLYCPDCGLLMDRRAYIEQTNNDAPEPNLEPSTEDVSVDAVYLDDMPINEAVTVCNHGIRTNSKIFKIKAMRDIIPSLGLREAKELVEMVWYNNGDLIYPSTTVKYVHDLSRLHFNKD